MQPWFTVYFGIGYPCYDQMTPVKTRYPLTSITWPYRGLKLKAHRAQVFFWSWLLTRCCFLIGSRAGLFGKLVNAHPGLNINQIITFSSMQMFLLLFLCIWWLLNSKQKAKQYTENLSAKVQNSNQNSTFSWVSLIELWTTRSRSYAFRLA